MRSATMMDAEQIKWQMGRICFSALAGLYIIVEGNAKKLTGKFTKKLSSFCKDSKYEEEWCWGGIE